MTPRKVEVPREKPWLCLRTAMMSSSREMSCMHSVRSAYLVAARTPWVEVCTSWSHAGTGKGDMAETSRQMGMTTETYLDIGKFVLTRGPLHFKAATSYASAA